jgi:hypothetical protein
MPGPRPHNKIVTGQDLASLTTCTWVAGMQFRLIVGRWRAGKDRRQMSYQMDVRNGRHSRYPTACEGVVRGRRARCPPSRLDEEQRGQEVRRTSPGQHPIRHTLTRTKGAVARVVACLGSASGQRWDRFATRPCRTYGPSWPTCGPPGAARSVGRWPLAAAAVMVPLRAHVPNTDPALVAVVAVNLVILPASRTAAVIAGVSAGLPLVRPVGL